MYLRKIHRRRRVLRTVRQRPVDMLTETLRAVCKSTMYPRRAGRVLVRRSCASANLAIARRCPLAVAKNVLSTAVGLTNKDAVNIGA